MFQIVFLTHMGRNLEILFKRIYWQVLLQKAIDNRTMMIGHPVFADWFHRLDQDGQELALLYLLLYVINNTHRFQVGNLFVPILFYIWLSFQALYVLFAICEQPMATYSYYLAWNDKQTIKQNVKNVLSHTNIVVETNETKIQIKSYLRSFCGQQVNSSLLSYR